MPCPVSRPDDALAGAVQPTEHRRRRAAALRYPLPDRAYLRRRQLILTGSSRPLPKMRSRAPPRIEVSEIELGNLAPAQAGAVEEPDDRHVARGLARIPVLAPPPRAGGRRRRAPALACRDTRSELRSWSTTAR